MVIIDLFHSYLHYFIKLDKYPNNRTRLVDIGHSLEASLQGGWVLYSYYLSA